MSFASGLQYEFNSDHYVGCIRDGRVEAYYTLHFTNANPHILLIIDQSKGNKNLCSLWEASLSDEKILKHMEEEVGVDTSGFDSFPAYFCDAILAKPSLDAEYFPDQPDATTCAIRLAYSLGGMNLEGLLQFDLVQSDVNAYILEMLRLNYQTDKQSQITPATRASRPKKNKLNRIAAKAASEASVSKGDSAASGVGGDEEEEETVVKAKKRKVGGVSIFPGKKVSPFLFCIFEAVSLRGESND